MPYITEREAEIIIRTAQQIQQESRRPVQRKNRIINLGSRISVIVRKSQRRKPKQNGK